METKKIITRQLFELILKHSFKGKAIIILGPRQSGKTTLLLEIVKTFNKPYIFLNCDEPDIRELLFSATSDKLQAIIGKNLIVIIDEAQRVKNIGLTIKLMVDNIKNIQVIALGSSAFELSNEINEPLTGRKYEFQLLPFSTEELINEFGILKEKRLLEHRLIYGMYPDIINTEGQGLEKENLKNLSDSYLYKDIFTFQEIRRPETVFKLLESLALQVCSEISYNELSRQVEADKITVQRYIDLLEKSFVIFRLRSFSRNLRNELKKSTKIYFWDNGIRNAVINNFSVLNLRQDKGMLWENFLVSERIKLNLNRNRLVKSYFWRTLQRQEIDYIEEENGKINGYEFKWNAKAKKTIPASFKESYQSDVSIINSDNYIEFLTK
ncbi:MAG: ATP-binding protein [Candidatus Acididesulfobacter diazotrophicus]|jgi:hypothetical protein|uniref:ATP-binding protein n=1 Tax=Candidatus Acididesulfobacter diazotrophicus TaxID=2597226 RepID=A0A519BN19_9DELT|nr:MAG: ATP-binding protein [Candidatus Acididesulfobacter diazotrophicus]